MGKIYINEIWKPIYGYENYYEISESGIVRSIPRIIKLKKGTRKVLGKIIEPRLNNCGYLEIRISKYCIVKSTFIHVLLAEAFIPNPGQKKEVNHLNGIKTDNRLENLEWCTHKENMQHASKMGLLVKMTRPVINNCTGQIFDSSKDAAKVYDIKHNTLRNYLSGNIKKNPTCLEYLKTG